MVSNYPDGMNWSAFDDHTDPKLICGHRESDGCQCWCEHALGFDYAHAPGDCTENNCTHCPKCEIMFDDCTCITWNVIVHTSFDKDGLLCEDYELLGIFHTEEEADDFAEKFMEEHKTPSTKIVYWDDHRKNAARTMFDKKTQRTTRIILSYRNSRHDDHL